MAAKWYIFYRDTYHIRLCVVGFSSALADLKDVICECWPTELSIRKVEGGTCWKHQPAPLVKYADQALAQGMEGLIYNKSSAEVFLFIYFSFLTKVTDR